MIRNLKWAVAAAAVFTFTAHPAFAKHGADDGAGHQNEHGVEVENEPHHTSSATPATPSSSAASRLKIERTTKTKRGVLSRDEFTAQAKIAVPLPEAGITSVPDTDSADVQIELARGGVTYATCRLALEELDEEHGSVRAEFKVSLRTEVKKGIATTRIKRGSCDTDLTLAGDENTVPDLRSGDTASLKVNDVSVPVTISVKVK